MKRPIPADFCTLAPTMYLKDLKAHYKCGYSTLGKWLDRTGLKTLRPVSRHVPEDFAKVAPTMLLEHLMKHYGCHRETIKRWAAETGVQPAKGFRRTPPPPRQPKSPPADFAEIAPTMLARDLCIHYQTGRHTLRRWLRETGISPLQYVQPKKPKAAPKVKLLDRKTGLHGSNLLRIRASSIYDEAASVIQRERFAVYRCEENGKANPAGKFWRVGTVVMTPDQLLERAERYRLRQAA